MNELNPSADPAETSPVYYDRSTGLMVFGILTICLGGLCAVLVLFMMLGAVLSKTTAMAGAPPVNIASLVPGMMMYVVMAVVLVWLGVGSIQARRWARALLLIFSWSWLAMGLFAIISAAFVLPNVMRNLPTAGPNGQAMPALSEATIDTTLVFIFGFYGVIFVVLPAIWTFFYSSRHVKLTCEWRDPTPRWTDARPLPVLGLCLWMAFSVVMFLIMPLAGNGVAPFFGMFLTGIPGTIFYFCVAALWAYAAGLIYQLDQRGWWLALLGVGIFAVSGVLTYARHDALEMYQLMGFPQAQIDQIKKMGVLQGNRMMWMSAIGMLPFLGYLAFVRRYFKSR